MSEGHTQPLAFPATQQPPCQEEEPLGKWLTQGGEWGHAGWVVSSLSKISPAHPLFWLKQLASHSHLKATNLLVGEAAVLQMLPVSLVCPSRLAGVSL